MSHFNTQANTWDTPEKIDQMKNLSQKVLSHISTHDKMDILDFGCGTGLLTFAFLPYASRLVGVDTSEGMLEVFKEKAKPYPFVEAHYLDLTHSSLDQKFDLIVSSMAFHHLPNPPIILKKMQDMLKPNGQIAIIDLDAEDGSFHPDNIKMGVHHFGFAKNTLEGWANELNMKLEHHIINEISKQEKTYHQFLAHFSRR